ncbi:hypothetical protein NHX12_011782 [Muraenolepis orangiensis]|uniref:Uncharacterized protein n=1 Tax=Muraenolepis orangiensis TaxID=630683 RepID=A0A9Q0DGV1_9TELE|nr:hypothetical protein NHX12_011782 [Muraenolepis orangiensis]
MFEAATAQVYTDICDVGIQDLGSVGDRLLLAPVEDLAGGHGGGRPMMGRERPVTGNKQVLDGCGPQIASPGEHPFESN